MRHLLTLATLMALTACDAAVAPAPDVTAARASCIIDHAARTPWADWDHADDADGTVTFVYSGCGKQLAFIAAEHGNDPDSDTFKAVTAAMANAPDLVLIEGVPHSRGANFQPLVDYAQSVAGTPGDSEPMLTTRLAIGAGIDVMGAEPDDADVLAYAKREGIGATDVIGFYVLRQLPQMVRAGDVDGPNDPRMAGVIADLVPYFAQDAGLSPDAVADIDTLPEFATWYAALNGSTFAQSNTSYDVSPSSNIPAPKPTNRIADTVADARDAFILKRIEEALAEHDEVLIVYGGSHQTVQDPSLRAAFGAPEQVR